MQWGREYFHQNLPKVAYQETNFFICPSLDRTRSMCATIWAVENVLHDIWNQVDITLWKHFVLTVSDYCVHRLPQCVLSLDI